MDHILHVVFNYSTAASLRQAIIASERTDEVVATWDDLSMGPINPPVPDLRAGWLRQTLDWPEPDYDLDELRLDLGRDELVWSRISDHKGPLIAWMSRSCSSEYCGFMEFLRRTGEKRLNVADITDYKIEFGGEQRYALATGILSPGEFLSERMATCVMPLDEDVHARYNALWQILSRENAPLRVLENGELISASIDHLDERILGFTHANWCKAALIIGEILAADWDRGAIEKGDHFYWSRLLYLVAQGRVEARGDLAKMQSTELRLSEMLAI